MALDREAIAVALFKRLKDKVDAAKTFTRRDVDSKKYGSELHPVLILRCAGEEPAPERGRPSKEILRYVVKVYARNQDQEASPDSQLNEIVRQVEVALERTDDEAPGLGGEAWHTTLGGLVQRCWMVAPVEYWQGETSDEAALTLVIEALAVATSRG